MARGQREPRAGERATLRKIGSIAEARWFRLACVGGDVLKHVTTNARSIES